jgi:hypothetical protein
VEITTPYTAARTKADGTPFDPNELLHVKACWSDPTQIAGIIGISSIRVCSDATARAAGAIVQNTDPQDQAGDPFARCGVDAPLFDTAHWFPTATPAKDIPGKNNFGATYLYAQDLDPASVVFTIASSNGVPFTMGGQSAATVHEFTQADTDYVTIVDKGVSGGNQKWELKFFNKVLDNNGNLVNKNFKDTMPAGVYSFAVYAKSVSGACNQTLFSVIINTSSKAAALGPCQEDLFRGGTSPRSGSIVQPGDTLLATYYDETPPFIPPAGSDANIQSHGLIFTLTGATGTTDITGSIIKNPVGGNGAATGQGGEYKWKQEYRYILPNTLTNGQYTVRVQIYDSDQNKTGGDCGYAQWTVNFRGGAGLVELIE